MKATMILAGAMMVMAFQGIADWSAAEAVVEPGALPPVVTPEIAQADDIGQVIIDEVERRLIRSFYQRQYDEWEHTHGNGKAKGKHKAKDMPPGLAKRGELPPGLAKQLARNGTLPPGLEGRDLPPDLLRQLRPLHPDYRYVVVDDKVMLVRRATNAILDLLTVAAVEVLN